jgi:RNA polymerase sigma factor (sigma-70 family)
VSTVTWYEGAAGGAALMVLALLALLVRFVTRHDSSRSSSSRGQTIDTNEPASNVHLRADVRGVVAPGGMAGMAGMGAADQKGLSNYLLKELRRDGLLPAPAAERTPQTDARLAYQEKEAGFLLARAVEKLPARERDVLTLQFCERLAAADLATALGVSTSTVYRLRRNALKRLAEAVRPAFEVP